MTALAASCALSVGPARAASTLTAAETAPACVTHTTSWRYTWVTNACEGQQHVTVEYLDGTAVPCRTVAPAGTATFPGYGTQGNQVLRVVLCTDGA